MITKTIIENVLIISAEGFWLVSNYSQLQKLIKTRKLKGLYAPNQVLNAAGNIAWATYFFSRHLYVPFITNLTMMLITLTTLFYLLGNKKQFTKGIIAIAVIGPLTSYLLVAYPSMSGWVGVVYNAIASTPWFVHVLRTKRVSGISERSIYFSLSAMLTTLSYGILISSIPLITGCVIGLTFNLIIMRYYYHYRLHD